LRQNCASGLPNPARLALHLFVCGRGGLKKFAAEMLGTLRKSSELEICELSIDESAPERWCDGFRSGVKSACAPNLIGAGIKAVEASTLQPILEGENWAKPRRDPRVPVIFCSE